MIRRFLALFVSFATACAAAEPQPATVSGVAGFVAYGGSWRARDGRLAGRGDGGSKLLLSEHLPADFEILADVYLAPNIQWSGLIACVSDPGIGADRFFGYEISLAPGRKEVRLGAHRNNFELIRDVPCDLQAGQWAELSVRRQGSRLEVRVNGETVVTHDDGNRALSAGQVGFRVWQGDLQCRNFRIITAGVTRLVPLLPTESNADTALPTYVVEWPVRDLPQPHAIDAHSPHVPVLLPRASVREVDGLCVQR